MVWFDNKDWACAWTCKATFEGIGSHIYPLEPIQGVVASDAPRGIVLSIVATESAPSALNFLPPISRGAPKLAEACLFDT